MYQKGRMPHRGRIVAFNPRRLPAEQEEEVSIPSPDQPEEAEEAPEERSINSPISSEEPLFRFLNRDIWLDDIILILLIIVLVSEGCYDNFILPALIILFIAGFSQL